MPIQFLRKRAAASTCPTNRPLRIAMMTTVGVNVGDEFIREGLRSFLDEALGVYEPFYVNKHDPVESLRQRLLDEIDTVEHKFRDADVIVQAGTPVYWRLEHSQCYAAGWGGPLWDWDGGIFQLAPGKPFLNIGAGTCQRSERDLNPLLDDPKCVEFMRKAGQCAAMTIVRDPLASTALARVGVEHELVACPAFHAARRVPGGRDPSTAPNNVLAVNLMELAGHYKLKPETDAGAWKRIIEQILPPLREQFRLVFVAHDEAEKTFMEQFRRPGETIFLSNDFRDYLALYSRVGAIVANRVHGAVAVAGFGRPAVIVGNDSRVGIARPIGIPAFDSSQATAEWILDALHKQTTDRDGVRARLLKLREDTAKVYVRKIGQALRAHPATAPLFD